LTTAFSEPDPHRIGHAGLKPLLDRGKAVVGVADRRLDRHFGVLDPHQFELVDLAQARHVLQQRAVAPRPVRVRIPAEHDQRAAALALEHGVVDQLLADIDRVLPAFVAVIVPQPPEAPPQFGSLGRLLGDGFLGFSVDLFPDFLAEQRLDVAVARVADHEAVIDLAVRPEVDLDFADRAGQHFDRAARPRRLDPQRHRADRQVRVERLADFGVEVRGLHRVEDRLVAILGVLRDRVELFLADEHALAALAPRRGFRHVGVDHLGGEIAAQLERKVGVELGRIEQALLRRRRGRQDGAGVAGWRRSRPRADPGPRATSTPWPRSAFRGLPFRAEIGEILPSATRPLWRGPPRGG
jgi:hypothetical protein